ncbi:MAG: hypothetical protein WC756_13045 [Taibaiella sp.]|jgi:hypothetical protein
MNTTNIRHWQSKHNDWLRALNFYKGEIKILNDRLTEISGKYTSKEIATQVEHFQNQFVLHRDNEEKLEHSIRHNLEQIARDAEAKTGFVSNNLLEQLQQNQQEFLSEEQHVNQLRHEFNAFCSSWM